MPKSKSSFRYITDERMMEVMHYTMELRGLTQTEWCNKIGFRQNNLHRVRIGKYSFQPNHMIEAMKLIGKGNFNFLFGVESNLIRDGKKAKNALQLLREATIAVKMDLQK